MITVDTQKMMEKIYKSKNKITKMAERATNLQPILPHIANDLLVVVDDSFITESSPNGQRWKPLAPSTIAKRKGRGRGILHLTGKLRAGFRTRVLAGGKILLTNTSGYFDPHQRGDRKRAPARPPQRAMVPMHALGGGTYTAMTGGRASEFKAKAAARIKRYIQRGLGGQGQGSTRGA